MEHSNTSIYSGNYNLLVDDLCRYLDAGNEDEIARISPLANNKTVENRLHEKIGKVLETSDWDKAKKYATFALRNFASHNDLPFWSRYLAMTHDVRRMIFSTGPYHEPGLIHLIKNGFISPFDCVKYPKLFINIIRLQYDTKKLNEKGESLTYLVTMTNKLKVNEKANILKYFVKTNCLDLNAYNGHLSPVFACIKHNLRLLWKVVYSKVPAVLKLQDDKCNNICHYLMNSRMSLNYPILMQFPTVVDLVCERNIVGKMPFDANINYYLAGQHAVRVLCAAAQVLLDKNQLSVETLVQMREARLLPHLLVQNDLDDFVSDEFAEIKNRYLGKRKIDHQKILAKFSRIFGTTSFDFKALPIEIFSLILHQLSFNDIMSVIRVEKSMDQWVARTGVWRSFMKEFYMFGEPPKNDLKSHVIAQARRRQHRRKGQSKRTLFNIDTRHFHFDPMCAVMNEHWLLMTDKFYWAIFDCNTGRIRSQTLSPDNSYAFKSILFNDVDRPSGIATDHGGLVHWELNSSLQNRTEFVLKKARNFHPRNKSYPPQGYITQLASNRVVTGTEGVIWNFEVDKTEDYLIKSQMTDENAIIAAAANEKIIVTNKKNILTIYDQRNFEEIQSVPNAQYYNLRNIFIHDHIIAISNVEYFDMRMNKRVDQLTRDWRATPVFDYSGHRAVSKHGELFVFFDVVARGWERAILPENEKEAILALNSRYLMTHYYGNLAVYDFD